MNDTGPEPRKPVQKRIPRDGRVKLPAGHLGFISPDGLGGEDVSGAYVPVEGWPKPIEAGWRIAGASGVCPESEDRVIVVSHFGLVRERSTPLMWGLRVFEIEESPFTNSSVQLRLNGLLQVDSESKFGKPVHHITVFDREGNLAESWTHHDHLFGKLNRVFINPRDIDKHVWVSDSIKQKIFKFTRDGKALVMAIGRDDAKSTEASPWKGQDLAWLPNGDFYTVGLSRVDRFSQNGEHLASISRPGSGPGEFADLHGLVLDQDRHRIYVSDRGNHRIQVFDEEWNFISQWRNIIAPYSLRLSKDGYVWVGDGFTQKFLKYDLDGHLVCSWGQFGIAPGCTWGIHYFDTDEAGNLYIAESYGDRVQKYCPRDDVSADDPASSDN